MAAKTTKAPITPPAIAPVLAPPLPTFAPGSSGVVDSVTNGADESNGVGTEGGLGTHTSPEPVKPASQAMQAVLFPFGTRGGEHRTQRRSVYAVEIPVVQKLHESLPAAAEKPSGQASQVSVTLFANEPRPHCTQVVKSAEGANPDGHRHWDAEDAVPAATSFPAGQARH
jgi:hypothetical protein